jgi:hypothetical protein
MTSFSGAGCLPATACQAVCRRVNNPLPVIHRPHKAGIYFNAALVAKSSTVDGKIPNRTVPIAEP